MTTGLELYEALKLTVGEEVAKMIAEALPMSDQVATKGDLDRLATRIEAKFEQIESKFDAKLSGAEARIYQRMLTFNITLFLGLAGIIVAIVLKG